MSWTRGLTTRHLFLGRCSSSGDFQNPSKRSKVSLAVEVRTFEVGMPSTPFKDPIVMEISNPQLLKNVVAATAAPMTTSASPSSSMISTSSKVIKSIMPQPQTSSGVPRPPPVQILALPNLSRLFYYGRGPLA